MKNNNANLKISLIILAGGSGNRLGMKIPKALVKLDDKSLLILSLKSFDFILWEQIIVTYPNNFYKDFNKEIKNSKLNNHISLIKGGKERQESVYNALKEINPTNTNLVIIHDAARPFTTKQLITTLIDNYTYPGIIPALKPTDTIFLSNNDEIGEKLDREKLILIQTPQLFDYKTLINCHIKLKDKLFTDDSSIIKECGYSVKWLDGDKNNFKITTKEDLAIAKYLL